MTTLSPNSYAARGLALPPRRPSSSSSLSSSSSKPRLQAAASPLTPDLSRIIRPQAVGNWMLPSLATITPQYIETILRGAMGGNHVQQWDLFDLMCDTWPRLTKNTGEITGAVLAMDWKLEAWAEDDQPPTSEALDRRRLISDGVWKMQPPADEDLNGFEQMVADIVSAWFVGVSVQEILWEHRPVGQLGEFALPQSTFWVHPGNYAWADEGFLGLNSSTATNPGIYRDSKPGIVRFPERKFLIALNKAKSGPALTGARLRALAWWWCAANFSADWLMNRAQLFGVPFRWATIAQNADDATVTAVGNMLSNMGSSGYGAFPEGTNLNFLEAGQNSGQSPQADLIERADKNCDLIILGQTLTSETGPSGGGSLALGKVHAGVREQIIQSVANFAARVLNQQLVPAILVENFGHAEAAPYFCPAPETEKDLQATATLIQTAVSTGLQVPKKWAHAELNIPLPQAGEEIIERAVAATPLSPGGGRPPQDGAEEDDEEVSFAARHAPETPEEQFRRSVAEKPDAILKLLHRIAEMKDDAAMLATLQQFYTEIPMLTHLVTADVSRQARAIEGVLAPAFVQGLQRK